MKKNEKITSRDVDFAKWYTDIVNEAHLACYSKVKGCIVIEPNGYAIWERMQEELDKMFKETGHRNIYMPMLIPENLMNKEQDLINGFAPEVAWVTQGGSKKLDERMCIRPTSETLFSDYYSSVLKSYKDLPMKYNQWCSVLRWEKETRPFLRSREFLWQEGHTIHETKKEAEKETKDMLNIYKTFFEEYLAIPVVTGRKTESEKFAGAEYTLTVEALMYNGISLQSATSHFFGQKFSKAYDIKFADRNNNLSYVYQTSWGSSTRMLGALIMVHGDDSGLVLPPKIAPTQVMIIPIQQKKEGVLEKANELKEVLSNFRVKVDDSDKSPGWKFSEQEMRGIPLRVEIGPKDIEAGKCVICRRDTREKVEVALDQLAETVDALLKQMQSDMLEKARKHVESHTYTATNREEFEEIFATKTGFVKAMWCGETSCEEAIKENMAVTSRCMPFHQECLSDKCVYCGKPAKKMVYWGRAY